MPRLKTKLPQKVAHKRASKLFNRSIAKVGPATLRYVRFRGERDAALKIAATALTELEAAVDSGSKTQIEIDDVEAEYEKKVDLLVESESGLAAACEVIKNIAAEIAAIYPRSTE